MIDMKKEKERIEQLLQEKPRKISEFHIGDEVRFTFGSDEILEGKVAIIDMCGGGLYYGICPSMDIRGNDGGLYKHVPIVDVELKGL